MFEDDGFVAELLASVENEEENEKEKEEKEKEEDEENKWLMCCDNRT